MSPRSTWLSAALAATFVGVAACSAPDPNAVPFQPNGAATSTDNGAVDSGRPPPPPKNPAPDSGNTTPPVVDAGSDAAAVVDASDASDAPSGPGVLSFTLLDTSVTNVILGSPVTGYDPIADNSTISLATVGNNLSIRANVDPAIVGSVGFVYNATNHTENAAPYTLCGDDGAGVITNCNLTAGAYTLTATPYSAANLGGTATRPLTIHFTLTP